ncbi:MAG: hypothetical protein ACK5VW_00170, partial [Holosporales bacterium]
AQESLEQIPASQSHITKGFPISYLINNLLHMPQEEHLQTLESYYHFHTTYRELLDRPEERFYIRALKGIFGQQLELTLKKADYFLKDTASNWLYVSDIEDSEADSEEDASISSTEDNDDGVFGTAAPWQGHDGGDEIQGSASDSHDLVDTSPATVDFFSLPVAEKISFTPQKLSQDEVEKILTYTYRFHEEDLNELLTLAAPLMPKLLTGRLKANLFLAICFLPRSLRTDFVDLLIHTPPFRGSNPINAGEVLIDMAYYYLVSPPILWHDYKNKLRMLYQQRPGHFEEENFSEFFFKLKPENFTHVTNHWNHILEESASHNKRFIAKILTSFAERMGFPEDHPILQKLLEIYASGSSKAGPRNIAKFHALVTHYRQQPIAWDALTLPTLNMGTKSVKLNPQKFKSLSDGEVPGMVPATQVPNCDFDFFNKTRKRLEERLVHSPQLARTIQDVLAESAPFASDTGEAPEDFASLMAGALGSAQLQMILEAQVDERHLLPIITAKLRSIVAYLESLDNEPTFGYAHQLTPREERFIRILSVIQACSYGKTGGIENVYNLLEDNFKFNQNHAGAQADRAVSGFVQQVIARQIESMFSGCNALTKELADLPDEKEVEQAVHFGLYLKNMIAHEVGLPHKLVLDQYSKLLPQSLIDHSKQHLIEAYYQHFTPEGVVRSVQAGINQALSSKNRIITFQALNQVINGDLEEDWDLDLSSGSCTLTPAGTVKLLSLLGYLIEKDAAFVR